MAWYNQVIRQLRTSGLFSDVRLVGAKVRATVDDKRFLDVHFDPTTSSYSYALIDSSLSVPGDKRLFGWDDCPHPSEGALTELASYPHHFQARTADGQWRFEVSSFVGNVDEEIPAVLIFLHRYLKPADASS